MNEDSLNIVDKFAITDKISLENYYEPLFEIATAIMLSSLDEYHKMYINDTP